MKTKRIISVFLAVVMCLGMVFAADAETEIPDGYTTIYTAEEFNNIRNNLDGKFILMNDIDLSVYENWEPIGTSSSPFTGELDGNGYQIKNLTISVDISEPLTYYYGLFGYANNSTVNNVLVIDADISVIYSGTENSTCYTGAIAGYGYESAIINSVASGRIETEGFYSMAVGGIVGRNRNITESFSDCVNYSDIKVNATQLSRYVHVGGISGYVFGSQEECCNFGAINVEGENVAFSCEVMLGGINGNGSEGGFLNNSYNRGNISIDFSTNGTFVGGLSGGSYITRNSYNKCDITLPDDFTGYIGAISGSIGGWGGMYITSPYVENVYYSETDLTVGYADCIHPDDVYEDSFEFIYKNFAELSNEDMKNQESFVGFDFENVWKMEENGYPVLKNKPKITVKEKIALEVGETFRIKPGKDYMVSSDSPLCIDYITFPENGEIRAIHNGELKLTVIYDYGYTAEYDITITGTVPSYPDTPDPEPENDVESAEIVYVPLKNRIVFSAGSPNLPDGIVLKLRYKDGTEKTETVIYNIAEEGYRAGEEKVIGSVRVEVVEYGLLTDTIYINDNTVSVEYDYFVPPTLSYIFMEIVNFVLSIVL